MLGTHDCPLVSLPNIAKGFGGNLKVTNLCVVLVAIDYTYKIFEPLVWLTDFDM